MLEFSWVCDKFAVAFIIKMNDQPIIQSYFQYSSGFPQNMLPVFSDPFCPGPLCCNKDIGIGILSGGFGLN